MAELELKPGFVQFGNMQIREGFTYSQILLVAAQKTRFAHRSDTDPSALVTPKSRRSSTPLILANMDCIVDETSALAALKAGANVAYPQFDTPEFQAGVVKRLIEKINEDDLRANIFPATGIGQDGLLRTRLLDKAGAESIVVDMANGHMAAGLDFIRELRREYGDSKEIIAGNICTVGAAEDLCDAGADVIKIGIGPGAGCTTRLAAGVGYPQLSAVKMVCEYLNKYGKYGWADGGAEDSGDINKAMAAGAKGVMAGSLFVAATETPADIIKKYVLEANQNPNWLQRKFGFGLITARQLLFKHYYGSTSEPARRKAFERLHHGQSPSRELKYIEGGEGMVPFSGKNMEEIINQLTDGMQSCLSYMDSLNWTELADQGTDPESWIFSPDARENGVHGVMLLAA